MIRRRCIEEEYRFISRLNLEKNKEPVVRGMSLFVKQGYKRPDIRYYQVAAYENRNMVNSG